MTREHTGASLLLALSCLVLSAGAMAAGEAECKAVATAAMQWPDSSTRVESANWRPAGFQITVHR